MVNNYNIITKLSQNISIKLSDEQIYNHVKEVLNDIDTLYGYLIYARYKNNKLEGWTIQYNFSQFDEFNTIACENAIDDIVNSIINNRDTVEYVIGYKQPSIELMLELYNPLMQNLALIQCKKWNQLEYEDALSICKYTMLKLYKKGYYIHKKLLQRAFNNQILFELKHNDNYLSCVSLEKSINDSDDEKITLADTLEDYNDIAYREEQEEREALTTVFEKIKEILIDYLGERQFEQIFRDYGMKHTTAWSRKKMQTIKNKFKREGITRSTFNKYL